MDRLFPPGPNDEPQKACNKCGEVKPLSEFYEQEGMKDGHRNNCKACHSAAHKVWYAENRSNEIARVKRWQQENKARVNAGHRRRRFERGDDYKRKERERNLLKKYGLSNRDFETLLIAQLGMCVICRRIEREKLHVDHDHRTGKVRGLLCGKCNKAIGLLDDDPRLVRSAEVYLRRARRLPACRRPAERSQRRLPDADRSTRDDA